jgi:hypothetical protein
LPNTAHQASTLFQSFRFSITGSTFPILSFRGNSEPSCALQWNRSKGCAGTWTRSRQDSWPPHVIQSYG